MSRRLRVLAFVALLMRKDGEVGLGEIEQRLRALGSAKDSLSASKQNTVAAGALGGIASIALAYLLGRRRGRKRATILEVERR